MELTFGDISVWVQPFLLIVVAISFPLGSALKLLIKEAYRDN